MPGDGVRGVAAAEARRRREVPQMQRRALVVYDVLCPYIRLYGYDLCGYGLSSYGLCSYGPIS